MTTTMTPTSVLESQYRRMRDELDRMEHIAESTSPRVVGEVVRDIEVHRWHMRCIEQELERRTV